MEGSIKNKINDAGLITLDVQKLIPIGARKVIDLSDWLDERLVIREAAFKNKLQNYNWSDFEGAFVAVFCSKDVIVPPWSYLLIQVKLRNIAKEVFFCDLNSINLLIFQNSLRGLSLDAYKDKRVFLKVCSGGDVPVGYLSLCVHVLTPYVKSLFYGEPCSGVPLIKN